jgi:hypothetical protein
VVSRRNQNRVPGPEKTNHARNQRGTSAEKQKSVRCSRGGKIPARLITADWTARAHEPKRFLPLVRIQLEPTGNGKFTCALDR